MSGESASTPARIAASRSSQGPKRFQMLSVPTRSVFMSSPPALPPLILLREPISKRREVLEHRRRARHSSAADHLESVRPGLARAEREHRHELVAGLLAVVNRAFVERTLIASY